MTDIDVSGVIDSALGTGVFTTSSVQAGDGLTLVKVQDITANINGITATQTASGGDVTMQIAQDGVISAANGTGIYAFGHAMGGRVDTIVDAGPITSGMNGIEVVGNTYDNTTGENSAISVTTGGDVVSTSSAGIVVSTNDADTTLTVGHVVSGGDGRAIQAQRVSLDERRLVTLELLPGYGLVGTTIASVVNPADTRQVHLDLENSLLVLGGDGAAAFDLGRIDNSAGALASGDANRVTGFGVLNKVGDSVWTLAGANNGVDDGFLSARIDAGILNLNTATLGLADAGSIPGATGLLTISSGGTLSATGVSVVDGNIVNEGTLLLSNQYAGGNGFNAGDVLTVAGDYVGANGVLRLDTALGNDTSPTDRLIVAGNTSGTTNLVVTNVGGAGAPTVEGIKVVDIGGTSAGQFALVPDYLHNGQAAVVGGAYAYKLYQGGTSTPADGDWYLRSELTKVEPLFQPGASAYETYMQSLLALNTLPTLQERVGNRSWANGTTDEADQVVQGDGFWWLVDGGYVGVTPQVSNSLTIYEQSTLKLQAGVERTLATTDDGVLVGGLVARYGNGLTTTRSPHGDGQISTNGYGVGGTLTWYGDSGLYVDSQAHLTWYNSDLTSLLANTRLANDATGFGYAVSLEAGQRIALNSAWSLTPQAQLIYSGVDAAGFVDVFGAPVSFDRGDNLLGRFGLMIEHETTWQNGDGTEDRAHIYGVANLHFDALEGTRANVAGTHFDSQRDSLWGSVGVGGSYNWNDDKFSLYGKAAMSAGLNNPGNSIALQGQLGLRVRW